MGIPTTVVSFSIETGERNERWTAEGKTAATIVRREIGRDAEIVWHSKSDDEGYVYAGAHCEYRGKVRLVEGVRGV